MAHQALLVWDGYWRNECGFQCFSCFGTFFFKLLMHALFLCFNTDSFILCYEVQHIKNPDGLVVKSRLILIQTQLSPNNFFLTCEEFLGNVTHFFSYFFFFGKQGSAHTYQLPPFMPGSVHSGSANWDDCGQTFPGSLMSCMLASFPDKFPL